MTITNKTKNTILASNVLLANTSFKRMRGLLGKKKLKSGEGLILKPANSIHTFFMHFPIDVIFVNKNNQAIKVMPNLPPWRISPIYLQSNFVIELPQGSIQSSQTSQGDEILIQ